MRIVFRSRETAAAANGVLEAVNTAKARKVPERPTGAAMKPGGERRP
ncbi:MAG TPA: hypothetical protein VGX68_10065 [Thermoanaerobaculia bacterium]|nr:hypothetical protein [Thermoanaerobaculia bacterium]